MIYIILAIIIEVLYVMFVTGHFLKVEMSKFQYNYIAVITITNILTACVWFFYLN
jgi:hypothetical protein